MFSLRRILPALVPLLITAGALHACGARDASRRAEAVAESALPGCAATGFFDLQTLTLEGEPVDLGAWRGRVVLAVNVASKCGLTPQYEGLEALHRELSPRGFTVLGFPSNDFLNQEPGSPEEIREFCSTRFDVTFPLFEKMRVKGDGKSEVYRFLTARHDEPDWNFTKYLIDREGRVVQRFGPRTKPDDPELRREILALLEQPSGELLAATLNLWHDQEDWPARMAVILDSLRRLRPDVIFLQEVIEKEGVPNQAAALAESLGCAFAFASVDPPGAPKRYGNAILTRHPMIATNEVPLEPLDDYRVALHVRLDAGGRSVDAYATHLHHTVEGAAIRARQVEALLAFIDTTRGPGAVLLGGDFNASPEAAELEPIRTRLADSHGLIHPAAKAPAVTTLNPAKGHEPRRIDHLFVEPDRLLPVASEVFLDAPGAEGIWGSDHFGVWARYRWGS